MGFKVQKKRCDQCLFTDNRIVSERRAQKIVRDCLQTDRFFNCHKLQTKGVEGDLCCRGFWDLYKDRFNLGRIAQRLNAVEEVEID